MNRSLGKQAREYNSATYPKTVCGQIGSSPDYFQVGKDFVNYSLLISILRNY